LFRCPAARLGDKSRSCFKIHYSKFTFISPPSSVFGLANATLMRHIKYSTEVEETITSLCTYLFKILKRFESLFNARLNGCWRRKYSFWMDQNTRFRRLTSLMNHLKHISSGVQVTGPTLFSRKENSSRPLKKVVLMPQRSTTLIQHEFPFFFSFIGRSLVCMVVKITRIWIFFMFFFSVLLTQTFNFGCWQ